VAIVTGGGRGLGRAFARALAIAGAKVVVISRTEDELKTTVQQIESEGGTSKYYCADVTNGSELKAIVTDVEERLGSIDVLVNNAAVLTPLGYDWEVNADEWWRTIEINLRGPFLCTQAVLTGMMRRKQGRIVNITSVAAHTMHPYGTAYCSSKAALSHMTHLFADGVKEYGICAFALSPGGPSAMSEILSTSPVVPESMRENSLKTLQDGGGMEKSVEMLMFLLSGQADVLTGRHISWWDNPEELLQRRDEIVQNDLFTLGLRI
jgi:NAD(P)-dependent dehydrogenase (short-subunit alcohol dehydrogenase family)